MVGIELDETRVDFARSELTAFAKQRAVEFSVVQSEIEPMLESFQANGESFDFVFIDADKLKSDFYVRWAWENLPPNGLILLDNAFLFGAIEEENVELIEGARPRVTRQNRQSFQNIWDFVRSSEEVDFTFIPTGEGMLLIQRSLDGRE